MPSVIAPTRHACGIILGRLGVMVRGPSGSGKSMLCHQLVEHWRTMERYSTWVGDDRLELSQNADRVIMRCPNTILGKAEQRFVGIVDVAYQTEAIVDVVVDLVDSALLERIPAPASEILLPNTVALPLLFAPMHNTPLAHDIVFNQLGRLRQKTA